MKIAIVLVLITAAYLGYEALRIRPLYEASQRLAAVTVPFERADGSRAMLVLGDSIAFGVGAADRHESVAGRLASQRPDYSVENHAVIGARVPDLSMQADKARRTHYDLVVIAIGANDIVRYKSARTAGEELERFINSIRARADTLAILTAGNVGSATLIPAPLRPLYHWRTLAYHAAFEQVARRTGTIYVNLYDPPDRDPFVNEPERFLAADRFHPSSEGYRLYFERVQDNL